MQKKIFSKCKRKLFIPLLLMGLTIPGIIALAYYQSFQVKNEFPVNNLSVIMRETFDPPKNWDGKMVVKKIVYENQGTKDALLRIQYGETFTANDGIILSSQLEDGEGNQQEVVLKQWGTQGLVNDWSKNNGWYYYERVLKPGDAITVLEGVQYNPDLVIPEAYKTASYELTFLHEFMDAKLNDAGLWGASGCQIDESGGVVWRF